MSPATECGGDRTSLIRRNTVVGSDGGVPGRRCLWAAGKSVEIDTNESPTLAIPCRPFEIVHQGPGVVALDSAAFTDRLVQGLEMLVQKSTRAWSAIGLPLSVTSSGTPFSVIKISGDP